MAYTGGCFCGALRYQVSAEVSNATTCHCESCRRVAAAPAVSWFTVPLTGLQWLNGAPVEFQSSPGVTRSFCAACGTPLTYRSDQSPGEIDITLCSLDAPSALAPRDHTQTSGKLPWDVIGDGLPEYPRSRSEGRAG